jgi:hypothetical protein
LVLPAIAPAITAALVAAGVSIVTTLGTKLWLDRRAHRDVLKLEYEYEQRKALRTLIGLHHGRLLDCATSWHRRMLNIYANAEKGWLNVHGNYHQRGDYYFRSTVYRFLSLEAHCFLFAREQIFIDARVAEPSDLDFVKFIDGLHWVVSDASLFHGLNYDASHFYDHVPSDALRALTEAFLVDGKIPTNRTFDARVEQEGGEGRDSELKPMLRLLDGVSPTEERLRWDRLVCLHLLTIAFVRQFGYEWARPSSEDVKEAVSQIQHAPVAANFVAWLPSGGLANHPGLRDVIELLNERAAKD